MSEYIKRDDLVRLISSVARLAKSDAQKALLGRVIYITEHVPAVDAVCIVRCKDCKHFIPDTDDTQHGDCDVWSERTWCDFFCGFGRSE